MGFEIWGTLLINILREKNHIGDFAAIATSYNDAHDLMQQYPNAPFRIISLMREVKEGVQECTSRIYVPLCTLFSFPKRRIKTQHSLL